MDVRTLDINTDGSAVVAERNLAPGIHCQLVFSLMLNGKPSAPMTAPVKVVFGSLSGTYGGFRLGLTFGALSSEVQDAIQHYCRL